MLRFIARIGLVRLVGRRTVPALLVWDVAVLTNRVRQIPLVDRALRRGVGATRRAVASTFSRRRRRSTAEGPPPASSDPSEA
jgi:hypothetical protein